MRNRRFFNGLYLVVALLALFATASRAAGPVEDRAARPGITLELPSDAQGRAFVGAGVESILTVRADGDAPVTVHLGQRPDGVAAMSFSPAAAVKSLSVTTRGGADNVAVVPVRGDRPSAVLDDLVLTAAVGGLTVAEQPLTVLQVDVDAPVTTLLNDATVTRTLTTTPAVASLAFDFAFFRGKTPERDVEPLARARTFHSVHVTPENGEQVITGADGRARFHIQAGIGGQGWVYGQLSVEELGLYFPLHFDLNQPTCCMVCCSDEVADAQDTGFGAIGLYAGERRVKATDLVIPGRGFDFALGRSYRSQASHLRKAATGDFAVDWAIGTIDDRLIADGHNVIVFRPLLRTDVFVATAEPGRFVAPMEYYEQLTVTEKNNFELRDRDGMVKTYRGFHDPYIPGRLLRQEDRNGNFMSFLYGRPRGLSKVVLTRVVDTLGRTIHYRYYAEHDPNPGRRGRLQSIRDFRRDRGSPGRVVRFDYDREGNLASVTSPAVVGTPTGNDFPFGKTVRYAYTTQDQIPAGMKEADRQRLLHNLTAIRHPNETAVEIDPDNPQTLPTAPGTARERMTYGNYPDDPAYFDRVTRYALGGTNGNGVPAGGVLRYDYEPLAVAASTPNDAFLKTRVLDRNGNATTYLYSAFDTLLEKREFTRGLREQEPAYFVTQHRYNLDKERVLEIWPEGNRMAHVFDEDNPDRFQQGNSIRSTQFPDQRRGGDQAALFSATVYEPIYQQVAATTDSRGLDPDFAPPLADPTSRSQAERYTTRFFFDYQEAPADVALAKLAKVLRATPGEVRRRLDSAGIRLGLGDLNGDGRIETRVAGNVVREIRPPVVLLAGSKQAAIEGDRLQDVVTLYRYNRFGQKISQVDPEGNVDIWTYFPETDPDGDGIRSRWPDDYRRLDKATGGYLAQEVRDALGDPRRNNRTGPAPTRIRTRYAYDDVGNAISVTDGRGIRTAFFVNELNQVVRTVRAAAVPPSGPGVSGEPLPLVAFAYLEHRFYDFNDNLTRREVEDRGDTSSTGGFIDHVSTYDILDNPIRTTREVDVTETLVTRHRYDANENPVLTLQPEGNATASVFDERDLLFRATRGAVSPPRPALLAAADPGGYDVWGGVPSTMTHHYDRNRNLVETADAADTDLSPANNSRLGGAGDRTRYLHDGFDRQIGLVDSVGNRTVTQYDPVGNVVRVLRFGPVGGPSPTSDGGIARLIGGNLLEATENRYDEHNRLFQSDRVLFVNTIATVRPADVADGSLTPGDAQAIPGIAGIDILGRVSSRTEYDRLARVAFTVQDDGDVARTFYDGADRTIRTVDPEGNVVEMGYDDSDNVIEVRETDVSQVPGVASEVFLTTHFYDSLHRLQRRVDNVGQTTDYRYDSRDNMVAMADPLGPLTGAAIARRVFAGGALTVNAINDFGNVTRYFYDGLNRRIRADRVLTASGQGDGVNPGANIFGVKTAIPAPDPSQGSGDGLITVRHDWDGNSLLASLTDDNGNRTQYGYDNLDRRLTETKGISVAPNLADRIDPPTTIRYRYDPDDNVIRQTDENGSVKDCRFDAIDRVVACRITRAAGVVGTTATTFQYDGLSRVTRATDDNDPDDAGDDSVLTLAYDSLSRIVEETQTIGDLPARAISNAWRAENLRASLTYPNGRVIAHTYDRLDRLDTVADQGAAQAIADYDYIGMDRIARRLYPINGIRMTWLDDASRADVGYDGVRRPVQLRHLRVDGSLIVGFTHDYDRADNKQNERKLHAPVNDETYRYDAEYRLVRFDRPTTGSITPLHSRWQLDGPGNWRQVDTETRRHSSFNELIERRNGGVVPILYDDNGNEIDDGAFVFAWDYRNRLRTVTRKSDGLLVAVYAYDAADRRIRKTVTNSAALDGTTNFYLDREQVIEERNGADVPVQQYVYGTYVDEPLVLDQNLDGDDSAIGAGDRRFFYHRNTLYSVFALTDAGAAIVEGYQYEAYGRQTVYRPGDDGAVGFGGDDVIGGASALGNPYLFTGRRLDPEARLYYYRARYLNTVQGRFISRDPVLDPVGIWSEFTRLGSGYTYVDNKPTAGLDPEGLAPISTGCGKFDVQNTAKTNATIGGANGSYSVKITFEPTETCCCCTDVKIFQMARLTYKSGAAWRVHTTPGRHNKSWHQDANGWVIDTATTGTWWYTGDTPKFGRCKPAPKKKAEITDPPAWNKESDFSFIACSICTSPNAEKGRFYGCVSWGFKIGSTGTVTGKTSGAIYGPPATGGDRPNPALINNDATVKKWNGAEANDVPSAKQCCKDP